MEARANSILTPDQRLRVFISSTLQELGDERKAVRGAVENMHMIPIMFETGARPHAPRDLYRQYLSQSHIFVGIYWESYGWVAPEETISGLEDEYNLACDLPKLIYIKQSSGERQDRLSQLLRRIKSDDKVSYKSFRSADELGELILNDLALLLTERFSLTLHDKLSESIDQRPLNNIPLAPNALIGRQRCIGEIDRILAIPDKRLLTLTGPGGIGKTRLAIETATRQRSNFKDGVAFIALAPVRDHGLVAETICYTLGIKVSGGNVLDSLKLFLQDKEMLLIMDNFEQVMEASVVVEQILASSSSVKVLVTSRERLALSSETVLIVPSLSMQMPEVSDDAVPPAVELFVQRVKAIQPSFELTDSNREIIFRICRHLEGLPLSIELAAGQINLFTPEMLLQRLAHCLNVLTGNMRDLPERQKTLRDTIAWSFELLSKAEQHLLLQISVYHAGCLMSAIESMEVPAGESVYAVVTALIDKSLLVRFEERGEVRFQILESVREFSMEIMQTMGLLETNLQRQADYYHQKLQGIKLPKREINQTDLLMYLEAEYANIRQTLEFLTQQKDVKKVAEISWNLWLFWWVNAHTKEGYLWLKKAWSHYQEDPQAIDDYTRAILACNIGTMAFLQRDFETFSHSLAANMDLILNQNDDELIATAMLISGVVKTIIKDYASANQMLDVSLERFQKIGLTTGTSLALSALGRNAIYDGNRTTEAKEYYRESMAIATAEHNEISVIIALSGFALCEVMEKNADAKNYLRECILLSQSLHFFEALAWSLEIWALVSLNENRLLHALTLMGAVDKLRETAQIPAWEDLQVIMVEARNGIRAAMDPAIYEVALEEGANMGIDKAMTYAMEG